MNPEPTIARQLQAIADLTRQIAAASTERTRRALEDSRANRERHLTLLLETYRTRQASEQAGLPVQQELRI
jgi:hypothetical protein